MGVVAVIASYVSNLPRRRYESSKLVADVGAMSKSRAKNGSRRGILRYWADLFDHTRRPFQVVRHLYTRTAVGRDWAGKWRISTCEIGRLHRRIQAQNSNLS